MKQTANDLTNEILDYLFRNRILAWRNNTTGLYDPRTGVFRPAHKRGISDILGIIPTNSSKTPVLGRFLAIEVKTPNDKLSPDQKRFLEEVNSFGGLSIVARSLDDVINSINKCQTTY